MPGHSSICIQSAGPGTWTDQLMKEITSPTHRICYLVGPYLSPFSSPAMDSPNLIAVASGIGVTPTLSLILKYSTETLRRINLVWVSGITSDVLGDSVLNAAVSVSYPLKICRDAGLIEHFVDNVDFGTDNYVLIYYTGKSRPLALQRDPPPNVFIFTGRPDLHQTLSGIIYSISMSDGLPEELCEGTSVLGVLSTLMLTLILTSSKDMRSYQRPPMKPESVTCSPRFCRITRPMICVSMHFHVVF